MPTTALRPPVEIAERCYIVADLAAMPSDLPSGPVRYELDNGRLLTMTPPGDIHGAAEARITAALHQQGERGGHGETRGEVGIVLWREPADRVVGADAAFLTNASLPPKRSPEGYLETIPELVVEVASPNDTRPYLDRKISDYIQAGVREVWLADPRSRTLTIHRRGTDPSVLTESDILRLETIIPGFELPIAQVFAD